MCYTSENTHGISKSSIEKGFAFTKHHFLGSIFAAWWGLPWHQPKPPTSNEKLTNASQQPAWLSNILGDTPWSSWRNSKHQWYPKCKSSISIPSIDFTLLVWLEHTFRRQIVPKVQPLFSKHVDELEEVCSSTGMPQNKYSFQSTTTLLVPRHLITDNWWPTQWCKT